MALSGLLWEESLVARMGDERGDLLTWFLLKLQELYPLSSLLLLFVSSCVAASYYIAGDSGFLLYHLFEIFVILSSLCFEKSWKQEFRISLLHISFCKRFLEIKKYRWSWIELGTQWVLCHDDKSVYVKICATQNECPWQWLQRWLADFQRHC